VALKDGRLRNGGELVKRSEMNGCDCTSRANREGKKERKTEREEDQGELHSLCAGMLCYTIISWWGRADWQRIAASKSARCRWASSSLVEAPGKGASMKGISTSAVRTILPRLLLNLFHLIHHFHFNNLQVFHISSYHDFPLLLLLYQALPASTSNTRGQVHDLHGVGCFSQGIVSR
jgi:hypothetical protein